MLQPFRPMLAALALLAAGPALAADSPWSRISESAVPAGAGPRQIVPRKYVVHRADPGALKQVLAAAPLEGRAAPPLLFAMPNPDGGLEQFRVLESPIMEPGLAERYPQLRTYTAQGVDDPTASGRLDMTPDGFHGYILSERGTFLIDPYRKGDPSHYVTYWKRDYERSDRAEFTCGVTDPETPTTVAPSHERSSLKAAPQPLAQGATLRTYRLALAATGEYTAYHGGSVAAGLAAQVVAMNRVDAVYERELTVRMVLVANNDLLVYVNPTTDPYTNNNGGTMLGQNQTNVNNVIGSTNYDVGHVFSTGGGGVAGLGVVCVNGQKARGVTGLTAPTGDAFYIDYVAHEMGHEFGANHTFNGTLINCSGNRSAGSAYEPGSGITIMGYAGICGADDLAPHSIDTFHSRSYNEIVTHITTIADPCSQKTSTGNAPPVPNAGAAFTIPISTPFALTGSATDGDGDALTYEWEEFDLGTAAPPNTDDGSRPIFRPFLPSTSPTRLFPQLSDILANNISFGESYPTTNRTMTYRLIARDNKAGGGGVDFASTTVTSTTTSGPFQITGTGASTWTVGGGNQTITWDIANTTAAPVSCANVALTLSTDGGFTFPVTLAASTTNDGTEAVAVPNNPTALARVKAQCVGNIFFDISNSNFTIQAAVNTAPTFTPGSTVNRQAGSDGTVSSVGTATDPQTPSPNLAVTTTAVPSGVSVSQITTAGNGTVSALVTAGCAAVAGGSNITFQASDGTLSNGGDVALTVTPDTAPTLGNYGPISLAQGAYGSVSPTGAPADNGHVTSVTATVNNGFTGVVKVNPETGIAAVQNAGPGGTFTATLTPIDNCGTHGPTKTFDITVTAPNTNPTITAGSALTRQQGSPATNSSIATVGDNETPVTSLVVTVQSAPTGVTVTNIVVAANGNVTGDVAASCTGLSGTIVLKVTDGGSATATANLGITVNPNTAPTLTYANTSVALGAGKTVNPATGPSDNGSISTITTGTPGGFTGTVTVNNSTGVVTVTNAGPVGQYNVVVTATDNCNAQSQPSFQLTVGSAGLPTITPSAALARKRLESAAAQIATVTDPDTAVGTLVVTVMSAPAGINITNIVNTNGTITATVAAACNASLGQNIVVLKVSDGANESTGNLTVNVSEVAAIVPAGSPICAGSTLYLTVNDVAGATYAWSGPGGFTSTQQNPVVPNAQPGLYQVIATVSGCATNPSLVIIPASTGCFYSVTPCRVLDTRNSNGPYGGPSLQSLANRSFTLAAQCGVPADATSVAVNVTVTGPTAAGNLRIYPAGGNVPTISTINFSPGQTRANNAVVGVTGNPTGTITVYSDLVGTTDFILDVAGYFK